MRKPSLLRTPSTALAGLFVLGSASFLAACASDASPNPPDTEPLDTSSVQLPLNLGGLCGGEDCGAVVRGFVGFFDRSPDGHAGNGRSCGDCHMATDHFQLSPSDVEARFQFLQFRKQFNPNADDPLFRPIDADDFRVNGANASDFTNLRTNGLVRITIPLPPNIKLVDDATGQVTSETFVDLWRSVPSVLNVKLTGPDNGIAWPRGPNPQGGYQLDARKTTLQAQAAGALEGHAEITDPISAGFLDDVAAFQRVLFSSSRVADLSHAIDNGVSPLPDPDPPLNALEQQGKVVFDRACGHCHGGPGTSTPAPASGRYHDILSACPRPVDFMNPPRWQFKPCGQNLMRNARTYEFQSPAGTTQRRRTTDPGRVLFTGFIASPPGVQPPIPGFPPIPAFLDDFQHMDIAPLRGISKTAPYFHNNSAATLEEVLDHYDAFFKMAIALTPPGIPNPIFSTTGTDPDRPVKPEEREAILAYMRKL